VLAGDSSGGGLVLSLLLTPKQERAAMPGAAVLFCPWLDPRLSQRIDSNTSAPSVPSIDEARLCVHAYLGDHPVDDPIVDPLSADLTGLPPLLIQAATGDARLADATAFAIRVRARRDGKAGVVSGGCSRISIVLVVSSGSRGRD
jgi:acetyl esterase/lipase